MRIVCPECSATYDVPAAKLAGRRTVRCVRCGTGWTPEGPVPLPPPPVAPPPPPLPPPVVAPPVAEAAIRRWDDPQPDPPSPTISFGARSDEPPPVGSRFDAAIQDSRPAAWSLPPAPRRGLAESLPPRLLLQLAWAASIALVLGVLTALLVGHDGIANSWPPAQRLYGLLGLGTS